MTMTDVRPAKPVAPWMGGKMRLAKQIVPMIDQAAHTCYAEPFVGMGGIFFRRSKRPKCEIINDLNSDVINLFRILQRHYPQFMDCLKYQITSRTEFNRLRQTDPVTLTDLERAARFIYLQRNAFGGRGNSPTFGTATERPARFDLQRIAPLLEEAHERLSGVTFECLDWSDFITRYDRPQTLFYLDPPYFGVEDSYGKDMFERDQFKKMSKQLAKLKGRFVLSINDVPEIRDLFKRFVFKEVDLNYSIAKSKNTAAKELIITNF